MPFVEVEGARLFYRFDGPEDAPVLVLSNSLGTALAMWDPQIRRFAEHFRVLRYDSRGHGRSDATPGPYTIAGLGRDALALLDALGLARVHFCGVSKGGMVGQWLGINAPERVERLVLCNTSAHIGAPEVWNERIEAVRARGMAAIVQGVIDRWFTEDFQKRAPETVAEISAMLLATPPEGYVACCAAVRDMDQRADLPRVAAPTLVIAGRHDQATPPEHSRLIAERIPNARLAMLDAAHLSNVEADEAFTTAVLDFLLRR
jgi:3-oxoadipate enol-lactonase